MVVDFGSAKQIQKHQTLDVRSTSNPHFEKISFFQNDVYIRSSKNSEKVASKHGDCSSKA